MVDVIEACSQAGASLGDGDGVALEVLLAGLESEQHPRAEAIAMRHLHARMMRRQARALRDNIDRLPGTVQRPPEPPSSPLPTPASGGWGATLSPTKPPGELERAFATIEGHEEESQSHAILRLSVHQCELTVREALSKLDSTVHRCRALEEASGSHEVGMASLGQELRALREAFEVSLAQSDRLPAARGGEEPVEALERRLGAALSQLGHDRTTNANKHHEVSQAVATLQQEFQNLQARAGSNVGSVFSVSASHEEGFEAIGGALRGHEKDPVLTRIRNMAQLNEIGVEKLNEQVDELESYQRQQGVTVESCEARLSHLEEKTASTLHDMQLEVARCTTAVDDLQLGVAESHANATLRAVTSEQAAAKKVEGLQHSQSVLQQEIARRQRQDNGGHEEVGRLRLDLDRVAAETKAVAAKLHEVELMQVRVIALANELKFARPARGPTAGPEGALGLSSGGRAELAQAMRGALE